MYNRRERRKMAKTLGLTKTGTMKSNPDISYNEILKRSQDAGKQIHLSNTEEIINQQNKRQAELDGSMLEKLMSPVLDKYGKVIKEGLSYEVAMKIIQSNKEIEANRRKK